LALQYVNDQTPEICLAAVTRDGWALQFVEVQTPEICLAAVTRKGWALLFVKKQTPEICQAAAKRRQRRDTESQPERTPTDQERGTDAVVGGRGVGVPPAKKMRLDTRH
jgi:hypothetical protein